MTAIPTTPKNGTNISGAPVMDHKNLKCFFLVRAQFYLCVPFMFMTARAMLWG